MTNDHKNIASYMPLWIADYLADTTRLTTTQHGAYLLLLMTYWREGGGLPDDDDELAAIVRAPVSEWRKSLRPRLERYFRIESGLWRQKRADAEIERAIAIREKKSAAGAKGAANRWQTHGTAIAEPLAQGIAGPSQNDAISPSPSPLTGLSTEHSELNLQTPVVRAKRKPEAKGSRIPDDWRPSPDDLAYARAKGMAKNQIEWMIEDFAPYWRNKPGKAGVHIDWGLVWQRRVRDVLANGWGPKPSNDPPRTVNGIDLNERWTTPLGIKMMRHPITGEPIQDIGLG